MPGKKFFQLSDQQLDARRRGLEQYLEKGLYSCFKYIFIKCTEDLHSLVATESNAAANYTAGWGRN